MSRVSVGVTSDLSRSSKFLINAKKKGKAEVAKRCERLARDAERRANQYAQEIFDGAHESGRGSPVVGSFEATVEYTDDADSPVRIRLRSKARRPNLRDPLAEMLDRGTKPHEIHARTPAGMTFPGTNERAGTVVAGIMKVNHPGSRKGVNFMSRALDEALMAEFAAAAGRSILRQRAIIRSKGMAAPGR